MEKEPSKSTDNNRVVLLVWIRDSCFASSQPNNQFSFSTTCLDSLRPRKSNHACRQTDKHRPQTSPPEIDRQPDSHTDNLGNSRTELNAVRRSTISLASTTLAMIIPDDLGRRKPTPPSKTKSDQAQSSPLHQYYSMQTQTRTPLPDHQPTSHTTLSYMPHT